jgi:hypothetical protein
MAKRFTDSEKWSDPWFRKLPQEYQRLWLYILDQCDAAGVWKVDIEMASFCLHDSVGVDQALKHFDSRVTPFQNGEKWFIPKFVLFQYGALNESCNPHRHVIHLLKAYGLFDEIQGYLKGTLRVKDKEQDQDKDSSLEKREKPFFKKPSVQELTEYFTGRGMEAASAKAEGEKFLNHYESVGWVIGKSRKPMKSWPGAAATWYSNWLEWGAKSCENGAPKKQKRKERCFICDGLFDVDELSAHRAECASKRDAMPRVA